MRILLTGTIAIALALCFSQLQAATQAERAGQGPRRQSSLAEQVRLASQYDFSTAEAYAQRENDEKKGKLSPGVSLLLGVLVPGLPQFLDGRPRAWAYFAAEGVAVGGLLLLNSRGNSYENRYINLARAARGNFVYPGMRNNPTEEVDLMASGYGEYYEDLLKWTSSGDYDNDPNQQGVQPETDPRTYNGHQWEIARINNFTGSNGGLPVPLNEAEQQAALDAYLAKVYLRELNWDWTGLEAENGEYDRLFDRSESSYRNRNKFTGLLVANHIISVLDVLITQRLNNSEVLKSSGMNLGLRMYAPTAGTLTDQIPMLVVGKEF
jgi:hypothetical protein